LSKIKRLILDCKIGGTLLKIIEICMGCMLITAGLSLLYVIVKARFWWISLNLSTKILLRYYIFHLLWVLILNYLIFIYYFV